MNGKQLREYLNNGDRVYGTMIVSTSPRWVEVIDQLGLDFVFIDTEHITIDRAMLSWMCHAFEGKGLAPVVRIPSPDPYRASMALDGGARGVVAPYIESATEVRQLVGAVKYRPIKGQKLKAFLEGEEELEQDLEQYLQKSNEDRVLIANIESRPAIENLDEILSVSGLDAVLIGPHDLSCNLGIPEQYEHPEFLDAVESVITRARNAGIGAGIHAVYDGSMEREITWARKGANLILHSGDINRFVKGMSEDIGHIRAELGDQVKQTVSDVNI